MKEELDINNCDCNVLHKQSVKLVQKKLPVDENIIACADLFKVFGDFTRLKILCALFYTTLCVCDISVIVGMSKSAVSHQLRILRHTKLVKNQKIGKEVFYSLADEHIKTILNQALRHVKE